jgi:prevent-host-death family protein
MSVQPITQRELRNDTPRIMRAVEAGESFVLTRNGTPIADIVPHRERPVFVPFGELLKVLGDLPPEDPEEFFADIDRAADPDPFRGPGETER